MEKDRGYTIKEAREIAKNGTNKELIDASDNQWAFAVEMSEEEGMSDGCGGGPTREETADNCDGIASAWRAAAILSRERARRGDPDYE